MTICKVWDSIALHGAVSLLRRRIKKNCPPVEALILGKR
jgi:hypothetical protein